MRKTIEPGNLSSKLVELLIAVKSTIGPNEVVTGIVKEPTNSLVHLSYTGLLGDFQADRRVHGGKEKAVYQYPRENYFYLKQAFPDLKARLSSACLGENFSTEGLTEADVHIGDIFKLGDAKIQVSQPRLPCWKLSHRLGNANVGRFIISKAITGWYYRVIEEGAVQVGQSIALIDRIADSISVERLWRIWIDNRVQPAKSVLPTVNGLSHEWRW